MRHASKAPGTMPPTASGGIARLAVARAIAAGIDPEPLVQKAGLTLALLEDRDARIGARNQITLLNLVANAVGDDLLGFHLAEGSISGKSACSTTSSPPPRRLGRP